MDPLPAPPQLEAQLNKCKTVRKPDYYKPRTKTQAEIDASKAKLPALPTKTA